MKKLLMILTRSPYPIQGGRESILSQTIAFVKDEYALSILIFSKEEINEALYQKQNIQRVKKLFFPSTFELSKNLITMKNSSLQERIFYSKQSKQIILKEIEEFEPDIVYTDMIRTAQYIKNENIKIKRIVDIDDLLSIRYDRFIKDKESSIFGTFNHLFPSFLRIPIEKFLKNSLLKYEKKLISKREQEVVKKFDISFLVSQKETFMLRELTDIKTIYTNTQAIPLRENIYNSPKKNNLLFIGNMSTAQNLSSLKMIVYEILPQLTFDYQLLVVGKYDNRTITITQENKNIQLLGFVEDLEEVLKDIKLALMPISFGTGIKTKILDCMSYGIPVLTNSVGNEGLSTTNLEDIILFEKLDINSRKIMQILKDEQLLKRISQNGYKYIIQNHGFDKLKERFLKTIKKLK